MRIKRENWKGKYKIVIRENGKIKSFAKWSRKFNLKDAYKKYKEDRTLRLNVKKFKTSKAIRVIVPEGKKPNRSFAVRASIVIDGNMITATSKNIRWSTLKEAKGEAQQRLFMKIHEYYTQGYDADEGLRLFTESGLKFSNIRYETLYYT